jgi:hypothetical protein
MSRQQAAGQNHDIKIPTANQSVESVAKLRYLGTTAINQTHS